MHFMQWMKRKNKFEGYEPTVSVSTKKIGDKIEIKVKDNGNGIPQKVLDKIFQPFFTTKPTGQGTGLGLSLSYDIVKAHGGELKVETKEGEGAEFIIQLPIFYFIYNLFFSATPLNKNIIKKIKNLIDEVKKLFLREANITLHVGS